MSKGASFGPRWSCSAPNPQERFRPSGDHRLRGFSVHYRGSNTPCPGCSRSNWIVGRILAECAFCTTALPLNEQVERAAA